MRWLKERDESRDAGDALARAVRGQGATGDVQAAGIAYWNGQHGSAMFLPDGDWLITCYDYQEHRTAVLEVLQDEAQARARVLELVTIDEAAGRRRYLKLVKRNSIDPTRRQNGVA